MNRKKRLLGCVLLLGVGSMGAGAQAATLGLEDASGEQTVLYSGFELIEGTGADAVSLDLPGPGELFLTLTDLDFPGPLASLQFAVSNAKTTLIGLTSAGTADLTVASPITLYANVFAAAPASSGIGLYSLTATFVSAAPVPLPATEGLLASVTLPGLVLALLCGRRVRTTVTTAVA